jgi:hypothetical protein
LPDRDQFGHPDAFALFTDFCVEARRDWARASFPPDDELRHITIELLAEQTTVEEIELDPTLIDAAVIEGG